MNVGLASVVHFAPRLALRSADPLRGGDKRLYIFLFILMSHLSPILTPCDSRPVVKSEVARVWPLQRCRCAPELPVPLE